MTKNRDKIYIKIEVFNLSDFTINELWDKGRYIGILKRNT